MAAIQSDPSMSAKIAYVQDTRRADGNGNVEPAVPFDRNPRRFNGEIINCDALQMYKGLPIATNKISDEERKSVPHHLLDCIGLGEEPWTVIQFRSRAMAIIQEIRSRGKLPILAGGTHYYTQSLLFKDSLLEEEAQHVPAGDQEQRWPILGLSSEEMLEALRKVDPVMANSWHPKDKRKIRRSLEIWLTTGRKPSETYEEQRQLHSISNMGVNPKPLRQVEGQSEGQSVSPNLSNSLQYDPLIFWTHASTPVLRSRLDNRVESMLGAGLLTEVQIMHDSLQVQKIAGKAVDQTRGIWVAIGYKEFECYLLALHEGQVDRKELGRLKRDAIERTQIRTWQYAKNQIRWIRSRFLSALSRDGAGQRLFLLDGSDVSIWATDVEALADEVTTKFLQGADLPNPLNICPAAMEMLSATDRQQRQLRHCDACEKTIMTDDAWRDHLNSSKHKKISKSKAKNAVESVVSDTFAAEVP